MAFIKVTNAHPDRRGDVLFINIDHIVSIYEHADEKGGSLSTKIYGTTQTVWTVEESLNEVSALIHITQALTK